MPNFNGMWTSRQQMQARGANLWPAAPGAPTGVSATAGDEQATVSFTAPTDTGYPAGAITGYRVTASPGGLTATGSSSPITITGLTNFTAYTFTVAAQNANGYGPESAPSSSVTPSPPLQVAYTTPGTYSWIAPINLSPATVSIVCVGGGGAGYGNTNTSGAGAAGGGGGLGYKNGISVTAGNSYTVVVGAGGAATVGSQQYGEDSYFISAGTVRGIGGGAGLGYGGGAAGGTGGPYTGDGGGSGGTGGAGAGGGPNYWPAGGGGAGGYSGQGGAGVNGGNYTSTAGNGAGGAGGGSGTGYGLFGGGGGGGVGLLGEGSSGSGSAQGSAGGGGSGGSSGTPAGFPNYAAGGAGGAYGGGGGGSNPSTENGGGHNGGAGGSGAVRIIYSFSGVTRSFPSTNTGDL